jgi:hypothetical protein
MLAEYLAELKEELCAFRRRRPTPLRRGILRSPDGLVDVVGVRLREAPDYVRNVSGIDVVKPLTG